MIFGSRKKLIVTLAALVPAAAIVDMLLLKLLFGEGVDNFANGVIIAGAVLAVVNSTVLGIMNLVEAKRDADAIKRAMEQSFEEDYESDSEETA